MFSSPLLGNYSRFPIHAVLGKGSVGSSVLFCEKGLLVHQSNTMKRLYMFSSPILEKGTRFSSPVLGKSSWFPRPVLGKGYILDSPNEHWDRFYTLPSPLLGKGSICSKVQC